MVLTLTAALRHLRDDLAALLEPMALRQLCHSLGHRWRERLLDPVTTIHLFLLQILHGNTAGSHLPRLTGRSFSASAYCQARSQLPLTVLHALLRRVVEAAKPLTDLVGTWRGHRTWLVDGTGVSMPNTGALRRAFGQPSNQAEGCGFPVARLLTLFHAGTGMLPSFLVSPLRSHEMARASLLHPELRTGDVLVGDRAFGTFAHLALLGSRGLHGVFRMAQRRMVDFTPNRTAPPRWNTRKRSGKARSRWIRTLGPCDQVVEWYKPHVRSVWMSKENHEALPLTLTVRECRYQVGRRGFRVRSITRVTTLLDADRYPAEALADRYRQRGQVETDLAHRKTTRKMDVLHSQTEEGVAKELTAFAIVYNLVRLVMVEASRRQGASQPHQLRRRLALAVVLPAQDAAARADRQTRSPRPGGAEVQEEAGQEASLPETTAPRVTTTSSRSTGCNLTYLMPFRFWGFSNGVTCAPAEVSDRRVHALPPVQGYRHTPMRQVGRTQFVADLEAHQLKPEFP